MTDDDRGTEQYQYGQALREGIYRNGVAWAVTIILALIAHERICRSCIAPYT